MQPGSPPETPQPPWGGPPTGPPWTWGGRRPWRGMRWRASATILMITAWLVFILLYAALWSGQFSLFQNIVIFLATLILLMGSIGALWAAWGVRFAGGGWEHWR